MNRPDLASYGQTIVSIFTPERRNERRAGRYERAVARRHRRRTRGPSLLRWLRIR